MQPAHRTLINQAPQGNDVIDVHSFGALPVNGEKLFAVSPNGGSRLYVFTPELKSLGASGISSPPQPSGFSKNVFVQFVNRFFLNRNLLSVFSVSFVFRAPPVVLALGVLSDVKRRLLSVRRETARLAFVAYGFAFFVILAPVFADTAKGASFAVKGLSHRDIIALEGDVKQRELREKRVTSIRSQASWEQGEGSETRAWSPDRTVKPHERAAWTKPHDDIVRAARLNVQKHGIKSLCDNKLTNIQSRTGELADNVTNNNALLRRLKERGNVKTFSGGNVILQEIMYNDTSTDNTNSYSGYEVLNISQNSPISAAQFSITQYASAISISGLEMIQNSGKEAIIDLLDGRMSVAEAQLANRISGDIYLDGTGNSGKNITGLGAAVPDAPSSGTYGGIDRATWSFWQSVAYSGVTNGGSAVTASNIQQYMDSVAVQLIRGTDKPDLIVADNNYYRLYLQSLQSIQRISDSGSSMAGAGFASLKYYGAGMASDVVLDGGIGNDATANHMWFLNTKYLMFRPHADRNFVPIGGERQAVNQDAIVKLIGWAGNLTCAGSQFQGVLIS